MILLGVFQYLAGVWETTGVPGAVIVGPFGQVISDKAVDINDVAITVGSTVKFIGKVTKINVSDPHFQDIEITGIYPDSLTEKAIGLLDPNIPNSLGSINTRNIRYFHPLQLVVGS